MSASAQFLNASEAARRLGVSSKALRIYEERGLIAPLRTSAGWRAYGPEDMRRVAEVAALRALGFSLAQVERVLGGDAAGLETALAAHQASLEAQLGQLSRAALAIRDMRQDLAGGKAPALAELARLARPAGPPVVAFDLPWPWGGERFELREMRAITYIVGPLGCGKTRLARRLAEAVPGAQFLALDRLDDAAASARAQLGADPDPELAGRVEGSLAWLADDGATCSDALVALLAAIEAEGAGPVVVDMVEQDLDEATQQALIAHLRRRGPHARPLVLLTRASAILDLEAVTEAEAILLCPANHSPPRLVEPRPGAPGYEAVESCLASCEVRARTAGLIAWRPERPH